ncbi:MAG: hypothetical protein JSR67_09545 [Proteobacteria bacterium]|nr:hypothetical protein [Pseudomonadota bacterium]
MSQPQIQVAPDHFEVAASDTLLVARLCSGIAVCIHDTLEEAGALLHLRLVVRGAQRTDMTDITLASELLLLERCLAALRETAPGARHLQARLVAHHTEGVAAQSGCGAMLDLLHPCLEEAGVQMLAPDVAPGQPRQVRFRPAMGWVHTRE